MLNSNLHKTEAAQAADNRRVRPLRVTLVSHSGRLFGPERAMLRLAIGLARRPDFRPLVVVPITGPLYQRCRDYGVEVAVAQYPTYLSGKSGIADFLVWLFGTARAWPPLMARLRHFQPDVIYSNTANNPIGALAARRLRIGHVWHLHEFAGSKPRPTGWGLLARLLSSRRTRLVCNSEATRAHYAHVLQRGAIERIYNGIDFPPPPDTTSEQRYAECVSRPQTIELLVVAGIHDSKGHRDAVLATARLRKQGVPVQLTFAGVGDPATVQSLRQLVSEHDLQSVVEFIGFVENTAPLYKRAALTLVCGRAEGFGRAAVESMAWGTPVVAADSGGLPEIVRSESTGLLYTPGDWQALAVRIQELLENEDKYTRLSATGIDWVRQRFPARRYVREMAELLTRAAITRRPRLRSLYRNAITALPSNSIYGRQL